MPHAAAMPSPGLQALILCGPGSSFPTFTANPDENPKALLPVANRPMVWYPIDFCYRTGVTNITLICPPSSSKAMTTALGTNLHLTSFPLPRPDILAPAGLDMNTGTAEILRLPEVRARIKSDFLVLPCDLVCELAGEKLLQAWMARAASLAHVLCSDDDHNDEHGATRPRRSGGLGVWYETRREGVEPVKDEETDFIAVVPEQAPPAPRNEGTLLPSLRRVVLAAPMDSLRDQMEEQKGLTVRHALVARHPRVTMMSSKRDAHIYVFPRWVVDFVAENGKLETLGEDLVGWWAKATWQAGLADKLGLTGVLAAGDHGHDDHGNSNGNNGSYGVQGTVSPTPSDIQTPAFMAQSTGAGGHFIGQDTRFPPVPPMLAYLHPGTADAPLIRRVDTTALLLATSLQLAKLPSVEEAGADTAAMPPSPFAHARKIAYPEGVRARTTITRADTLVGDNTTVGEKTTIKESVVGAGCQIGEGARLTQCLLMDGVVVGNGCRLTRCVLGRRAVVGEGAVLTDCEVQENLMVEAKEEEKGAKLMSSEGLEATEQEIGEALQGDDDMDQS